MRISNIQNFAANSVRSVSKAFSLQKTNSNSTQNDLDRSPAIDTVSFGKFDQNYTSYKKGQPCIWKDVMKFCIDRDTFERVRDSIYFTITPTAETKRHPDLKKYEIVIINDDNHRRFDEDVDKMLNDFTKDFGLEKKWYKNLHTEEDFSKLALLHTLWSFKDKVEMKKLEEAFKWKAEHSHEGEEPLDVLNMHDRGFSF